MPSTKIIIENMKLDSKAVKACLKEHGHHTIGKFIRGGHGALEGYNLYNCEHCPAIMPVQKEVER